MTSPLHDFKSTFASIYLKQAERSIDWQYLYYLLSKKYKNHREKPQKYSEYGRETEPSEEKCAIYLPRRFYRFYTAQLTLNLVMGILTESQTVRFHHYSASEGHILTHQSG